MNQAGEQSKAEYYGLIRGQIEHHDNLVNQRVIWQIISQSFFFGAYASLLNTPKEAKTPLFEAEQPLLIWLLPIAGLLAGALTYASIIASLKSIEHLHKLYDEYARSRPDDISNKLFPISKALHTSSGWPRFRPPGCRLSSALHGCLSSGG